MTDLLARAAIAVSASAALALVVKSTIAIVLGLLAARIARSAAAAVRHAILAATFAAMLVLPLAAVTFPPFSIGMPVASVAQVGPSGSISPPKAERPLTAAPLQTERSMTISTTALMAGLWAAGAITLLLSLAGGVWRLNRIRRTALPWLEERGTLDELAAAAGVNRAVDLLVHEDVDVPITCGFRRSAIILPSDAPTWQRDALRRALVHELEHVRRLDWWTLLTARTLCGVYWFNPLAWLAYRQLSLEAERACDDAVVQREESTLYADQLVSLARRLSARHARPTLAMANRSDLAHRVSAILNRGQARGRAGVLRVSLVGGFAATLALIIAPIHVVGAAAPGTMTADDQRPGTRAVPRINRALLEAAEEGDLDDVRALLEAGAEVNAAVPGDGSPLIVAAREGNEKIVSYLLERGATPDLGVPGDGNPLIMAAREGHLNIVRLLLDQGASVNLVVPGDENALIQASGEGQLEVVKLLVAHGADVNARVWADGSGRREGEWRTPVTMALRGGHQAVVEFLKSVGATQ